MYRAIEAPNVKTGSKSIGPRSSSLERIKLKTCNLVPMKVSRGSRLASYMQDKHASLNESQQPCQWGLMKEIATSVNGGMK